MKPYRFTLQWPAKGEAAQRAGEFLARQGKRKSHFVILALNAWLDARPEYEEPDSQAEPLSILTEQEVIALIGKYMEEAPAASPRTDTSEFTTRINEPDGLDEILKGLDLFNA